MNDYPRHTIALIGNPNVGKSTLFNNLTHARQHTGNWPGKTIASAQGFFHTQSHAYTLVDLPGTYSLLPHSPEEKEALDFLSSELPDAVIVVCDATCLERNLNLVLQTLQVTSRVLLCINLMDEARRKQIHINLDVLEQELSVPVVGTDARRKQGLYELTYRLDCMMEQPIPPCSSPCTPPSMSPDALAECRNNAASRLFQKAVTLRQPAYLKRDIRIDRIVTSRLWGYPLMLVLLAFIFWLTLSGANYPSRLLSRFLFSLEAPLTAACNHFAVSPWLQGLLIQGMYRVLVWVVSVMLPPMAIFFPLFSLLEDSGYLPRIAYNLDYHFQKCKACGKQALTMCMGFGCNAAGVTGCRIISSPRERLIAILTNSFVPCNGRFPSLTVIITLFFTGMYSEAGASFLSALLLTGLIVLGIAMTFLCSRLLSQTLLKGTPSAFVLELPPYRMPRIWHTILRSLFDRTLFVLGRAVMIAAPAGMLLWILANTTVDNTSLLLHLASFLEPLAKLMGMDGTILLAFILGFPANEIVLPIIIMAYQAQDSLTEIPDLTTLKTLLTANGWNRLTALNVCLFSLMHWPCSTTLLTIKKETGSVKWMMFALFLPTVVGMLICMTITFLCKIFGFV